MLETSAAGGGEAAKPWAFEAGSRAVQAHCDRIGLPAGVERDAEDPGVLHLRPQLERQPLVSIVVPTAGQRREVRFESAVLVVNCIAASSNAPPMRTTRSSAWSRVRAAGDRPGVRNIAGDRLRLVRFSGPFDFSAKINLGAIRSEGEHLLLLNDDIEVTTPNWIERMVMYSECEGSASSAANCSGQTPAFSTSGSALTTACPDTSTAALPAATTATRTRC